MGGTRRTVKGQKLYQFRVPQVILENATMLVEASSPEEAKAKALRNEWDDIEWSGAALVDWEVDYDSVKDSEDRTPLYPT